MYPALAVLDRLSAEHPGLQATWIGVEGGMEADLVVKAGVDFLTIPAAGVHGVGVRRLPANLWQLLRGLFSARKILQQLKPDALFFTGGYVAVPMALAGLRLPTVLYIPDIEPGLALKFLSFFADHIAVTVEATKAYLPKSRTMTVTGYPVRATLASWERQEAYQVFEFSPNLPTLLVTGGSLGSLTINKALVHILPDLLTTMQVIHITGKLTWSQFQDVRQELPPQLAPRYRSYPYLHEQMGAAFSIADLVVSRAGASSIGEYPHFGIPAILVPYPHAWQYQKVNADYLVHQGAALMIEDADLPTRLLPLIQELVQDPQRRQVMKAAMQALAGVEAAKSISDLIVACAVSKTR